MWPACPACPALGPDFSCYVENEERSIARWGCPRFSCMELFPHCVNKFLYQLWAEDIWFHRSALVPSPHKLGESSGLPAELWGKRSAGVGNHFR